MVHGVFRFCSRLARFTFHCIYLVGQLCSRLGEVEQSPHIEKVRRWWPRKEPTVLSSILDVGTGQPEYAIKPGRDYHHVQRRH